MSEIGFYPDKIKLLILNTQPLRESPQLTHPSRGCKLRCGGGHERVPETEREGER